MKLQGALSFFLPVVFVMVAMLGGLRHPQQEQKADAVEGVCMLQHQKIVKRSSSVNPHAAPRTHEVEVGLTAASQLSHGHSWSETKEGLTSVWAVEGCTGEKDNKPIDHLSRGLQLDGKAAVRCCQHSTGNLQCASSVVNCPMGKTYVEGKKICEDHGMRLCTKDELESNVCCGTGCNFDSWLIWTSTEFVNTTTPLPVEEMPKEEDLAWGGQEEEEEESLNEEDLKPGPAGHLGGFRSAMTAAVSKVMEPLNAEVAELETKITAIATKKENSKADSALKALSAELAELSTAVDKGQESTKAANAEVTEAKDAMKNLKASLGKDIQDVVSSEDVNIVEASIQANAEGAKKNAADAAKTAKVLNMNQKYLKQIYTDLHHFPGGR